MRDELAELERQYVEAVVQLATAMTRTREAIRYKDQCGGRLELARLRYREQTGQMPFPLNPHH